MILSPRLTSEQAAAAPGTARFRETVPPHRPRPAEFACGFRLLGPYRGENPSRQERCERVRERRRMRSHFTPPRVIDGGRFTESLDGHPVGALAVLALFFRGFRAMQRRRRAVAVLSSRARASRRRPSARRSRGRSGLSRVDRHPETPPRRLTPKSTWLTLASGTQGGRKSDGNPTRRLLLTARARTWCGVNDRRRFRRPVRDAKATVGRP